MGKSIRTSEEDRGSGSGKRRTGRPRVYADDVQMWSTWVRVTAEERAQIEQAAELSGESVTAFLSRSALEAARKVLRKHNPA